MSSRTFAPALILCAAAACGGSSPRPQTVVAEAPPPTAAAPAPATGAAPEAAEARPLLPPDAAEVGGAVERVFKGAVTAGPAPAFAVGDFNGDDSQDLAVAVAPVPGRLEELNDELAGWITRDPFARAPSGAVPYGAARRRVLVEGGGALLAVIHGYGAEGWRDAQATQTFVLKDAAGGEFKARAQKVAAAAGDEAGRPRLLGDVIDETVGGRAGFIYYDGAHYSWYDPRDYKKPAPARVVHGGMVKAVQQ